MTPDPKPYPGRGSTNPRAKLTEAQVVEIKRRLRDGARVKDVAAEFGVTPNTISSIKLGSAWGHVRLRDYEAHS